MSARPRDSAASGRWPKLRRAALVFVFLWFLIGGLAHFLATDAEMRIVPPWLPWLPWLPWPRALVLVSGVFELVGAAGLLWQRTRRAAGVGLIALTIAVTPANVYMLQEAARFDIPEWVLMLRLAFQFVLLALIAWGAQVTGAARAR